MCLIYLLGSLDITEQAHPAHATCMAGMHDWNLLSGHALQIKQGTLKTVPIS
jgi:hypothetical protein